MENVIPPPVLKDKTKKKKVSSKKKEKTAESGEPGAEISPEDPSASPAEPEKTSTTIDEVTELPPQETHLEPPQEPEDQKDRKPTPLEIIGEILNPSFSMPESIGPYQVPEAVEAGDVNALNDLDEKKLIELKEVFTLFDADADGQISEDDLRATFIALGSQAPESTIKQMLSEAMNPLDFDSFVVLMGYKTIELDPEDVLLEAWSKWDYQGNGLCSEARIFSDLVTFGDRFSKKEAREALDDAPLAKPKTLEEEPMIDYPAFCRTLCGLRKLNKQQAAS